MANGYVGHFEFWRVRGGDIQPKAPSVKGQFGQLDVELASVEAIGNPVQKWEEPIDDKYKDIHLVAYLLRETKPFQVNVWVSNQFIDGKDEWILGSPRFLLVPALKKHDDIPPTQPVIGPHFLCYEVLQFQSAPKKPVFLKDQFYKQEVSDLRPRWLGVPVDKNGEGMWNEDVHLALYEFHGYEFDPPKVVYTKDQFAHRQLYVYRSFMLGVPSKKTLPVK